MLQLIVLSDEPFLSGMVVFLIADMFCTHLGFFPLIAMSYIVYVGNLYLLATSFIPITLGLASSSVSSICVFNFFLRSLTGCIEVC